MAGLDLASLTAPVDADAPCGPDLEADDDDAFLNYMSTGEMVLPDRYFVEDHEGNRKPFHADDRFKDLNLAVTVAAGAKLLTQTHDLRLLGLVAKLSIFDRKLPDFVVCLEAMAVLLETAWDEVHPSAGSGLRVGTLERLNEPYTVVTALNNSPLLRSRRFNVISWQSYQAAVRERGGGVDDGDTSAVDRVLAEECKADPSPIEASQAVTRGLADAITRITRVTAENDPGSPVDLGQLAEAVRKIRAMLDRINPPALLPDQAPSEAEEGATAKASGPPAEAGRVFSSSRSAGQALAAAARYLGTAEPSSPALLLLRQAQALIGKSFVDALMSLLPDHVQQATVNIAALPAFTQPLLQVAEKGVEPDSTSLSDDANDDQDRDEEAASDMPPVSSRSDAVALLERVAAHYRAVEPSSPIPLLIDSARSLVGKDFLALIRAMLPDQVLRGE